jgi:hypothetical protein
VTEVSVTKAVNNGTIGNSYSVCDDFTQAQLMAIWKTCKQVGMKVEVNR